MIERSILLQETSTGPTFVSNESACWRCPGACFGPANAQSAFKPKGTPATIAISARTLNGIAMRLFAAPLVVLVAAITTFDVVTNAYPLLQVLPLQLSILALFGALMICWSRVLRVRWSTIDNGLKESCGVPTMLDRRSRSVNRRIILSERGDCARI